MADDVDDMLTEFLADEGATWTYSRGSLSRSVVLHKSDQLPQVFDDGNGNVTEVLMVDFRGAMTSISAFGKPQSADRISNASEAYQVLPKLNEKCYHTVGSMVHIYTKQVPK